MDKNQPITKTSERSASSQAFDRFFEEWEEGFGATVENIDFSSDKLAQEVRETAANTVIYVAWAFVYNEFGEKSADSLFFQVEEAVKEVLGKEEYVSLTTDEFLKKEKAFTKEVRALSAEKMKFVPEPKRSWKEAKRDGGKPSPHAGP